MDKEQYPYDFFFPDKNISHVWNALFYHSKEIIIYSVRVMVGSMPIIKIVDDY